MWKHTGSKVQPFSAASTFGAVPAVVALVEVAEAELLDKEDDHVLLGLAKNQVLLQNQDLAEEVDLDGPLPRYFQGIV
jgi:hypothetical protein